MIKTYVLYLLYSPARPLCLILVCLVSDIDHVALEAEQEEEAVEPPVGQEWQLLVLWSQSIKIDEIN